MICVYLMNLSFSDAVIRAIKINLLIPAIFMGWLN